MHIRTRAKSLAAGILAALLGALPAAAMQTIEGEWHGINGDQVYQLELCGDGTALCAKLLWVPPDARPEVQKYVGDYPMREAAATGDGTWAATFVLEGHTLAGTVTQLDDDTVKVWGCAYVVVCAETTLTRAE